MFISNTVLLDNNIKSYTVLFRFSDMVEALAHVPFSMHQYYNIVPLTEIFEGTTVHPNWWGWGYMYPQMKKAVVMLMLSTCGLWIL